MGASAGSVGSECELHTDCDSSFCDRTVPGGYCSGECESDADCGSAGVCDRGVCLDRCVDSIECRGGFVCYGLPDVDYGVCGYNSSEDVPTTPNIGIECTASIECRGPEGLAGACIPERRAEGAESGFPGGMCVGVGCGSDDECGAGSVCASLTDVGMCLPACEDTSECRDGYVCGQGACVPPTE